MHDLPRSILASPDDDEPRLVWADELSERGDPRGELVVAQCALARLPRRDPRRAELDARVVALLAEHGAAWAAPVVAATGATAWRFARGLVDHVTVDARALRAEALAAFGVRGLRVTGVGGRLGDVLAQPELALVETLELVGEGLHNLDAERLASAPVLGGLRALELGRNDLDDVGVERLVRSSHLALERLGLGGNVVRSPGARALARLTGLRELDLTRIAAPPDWVGNHIGPDGVAALARLPLRRLVLRGNPLAVDGAEALAAARDATLVELDLAAAEIGPSAAWALAAAPALERLELLDLSDNALGAAGVAALAGSPFLPRDLTLVVAGCGLDDDAVARLHARYAEVLS